MTLNELRDLVGKLDHVDGNTNLVVQNDGSSQLFDVHISSVETWKNEKDKWSNECDDATAVVLLYIN